MTVLAEVVARFRADTSDMEAGTQRMESGLKKLESGFGAVGIAAGGALALLVDKVVGAVAAYNIFNDQAKITFSHLEGGAQAAQHQIDSIDELSVALGQNRESMADAAKYMQIMTNGAENNTATLTKLADTASGLGIPIGELSQRFGFLFQQIEAGGGNVGRAAYYLQMMGVLSKEQVLQLQGLAEAGGSTDQVWNQLMSDLNKWQGSALEQAKTWQGLKAAMHDVFEIDFGKAFSPVFESLKRILMSVKEFMDSPAFAEIADRLAEGVKKALGPVDSLAEDIRRFTANLDVAKVDAFIDKIGHFAPLIGTVSGLLSTLGADLLSKIPILGDLFEPLAGALHGGIGALVGFLFASKETRDALLNLAGALAHLIAALGGASGPITQILQALTPIAAMIINIVAGIVNFVATTAPLMEVVKILLEVYLAMRLIIAVQSGLAALSAIWQALSLKVQIYTSFLGAATAEQETFTAAGAASIGVLGAIGAALAVVIAGYTTYESVVRNAMSQGQKAADKDIKKYVDSGSTTSIEEQAARVNELARLGEAQNQRNADAGGIQVGGVRLGGDVTAQRRSAGEIKEISNQYDDSTAQLERMKTNAQTLMQQYGMTQQSVEALAQTNNIDLSSSLSEVAKKFADAANAAGVYSAASLNAQQASQQVANMQRGLAGSLGNQSFSMNDSQFRTDEVMNRVKDISNAAGNVPGIPASVKGVADSLIAQADAMRGNTYESKAYLDQQTRNMEIDHERIQVGHQMEQALFGLHQATFAYTQALQAQEQAARGVFLAERDELRAREELVISTNELSRLMQTGISHDYYDIINKTHDLDAEGRAWLATILAQVQVLNQEKDTMVTLQREYDAWNEKLTQVQDNMKLLQDILNHPLQGSGSMNAAIEQNKMQQDQIQFQINQLTLARGGIAADPSADPVLGKLTQDLNKLKIEGQQIQLQQDMTLGHEKNMIDQIQKLSEVSFTTAMSAATSLGALNNTAATLSTTVDGLKGPLDAANYQYKVTNDVLAPQVTLLQSISDQQKSLPDKVNATKVAHQQLAGAVNGVTNALFGIRSAHWAVNDAAYASARFRIDMLSHETDAVNVLLGQLMQMLQAYGMLAMAQGTILTNEQILAAAAPGATASASAVSSRSFDVGGFVPGPIGAPLPAIVHGGEFVLSHKMLDDLAAGRATFPAMSTPSSSMSFTIADGAIQVITEVNGNAPDDLAAEIKSAVEEAVDTVVTNLVAKGAHG